LARCGRVRAPAAASPSERSKERRVRIVIRFRSCRSGAERRSRSALRIARPFSRRDQRFESAFLQRRVACEPEDNIEILVPRGSTIITRFALENFTSETVGFLSDSDLWPEGWRDPSGKRV
jgi:hypothetical protein